MEAAGLPELQSLFQKIISLSVGFAFLILFIMLILGGIKFITSGGGKGVQGAQQTITYALIGILLLILGWLILVLISHFFNLPVNILNFCIGFKPFC